MTGSVVAMAFMGVLPPPPPADVTPSAVNWADIIATDVAIASGSNSDQTISSISVTIRLEITYTGAGLIGYSKNGGTNTSITSGGTILVDVTNTLHFTATAIGSSANGTVTIKNLSDGSTTLDTFTYTLTVTG